MEGSHSGRDPDAPDLLDPQESDLPRVGELGPMAQQEREEQLAWMMSKIPEQKEKKLVRLD